MFGDFPLSGKIVIVTGGASGIGLAFTKAVLPANARVIIADLKHSPASIELVEVDRNVRFMQCDVSDWKALQSLVPFSEREFGDVPDVYAANAGIGDPEWSNFWNDTECERYKGLDINLAHPIKLTRIAIRALLNKNKKGVVIITSSIAAQHGHFATALYSASKHGTLGFIKSLAPAETEANVKVVGICPGLVETPLLLGILERLHVDKPKPELIEPTEIAERMRQLVVEGKYHGGTALAVYHPGDVTIAAEGFSSCLEDVAPSDFSLIREILAKERGVSL